MTFQRAMEVLHDYVHEYEIIEVSRGVFAITYNGEADIVSEQNIIDLAREMEEME
jgi:hypothetical protein